ncbi:AbrB/MazE/SpoVT family DNA-binding domain-containing protein [Xylocopilactobacillus apicola]|uniref:Uncharacterized protein n=1 Tax=Xylocopilactobacillus apicola TaxID=2932184 RepID=A0AAU9DC25_9LACO|nr:AbrB/MazE/SpoVT family DNA-binding domain-containing protein [Xylocopilactobacillus apicola]BDR59110.1 hypothetical protein XA3_15510 [Xylocopilactobacillus apicola]
MNKKTSLRIASKITSKNQVTIRNILNIQSNDSIEWEVEQHGKIVIYPKIITFGTLLESKKKSTEALIHQKKNGVRTWEVRISIETFTDPFMRSDNNVIATLSDKEMTGISFVLKNFY